VKSRGWSSASQNEEHWLSIAATLHTTGRDSMNISNDNFSHFPRWFSFCHVIIDFPSPPSCYQFRTTRSSVLLAPFASSILDDSHHCNIVLVSPIENIESTVMEVAKGNFNELQFAFASKCLIETTALDYFSSTSYALSI